MAGYEHPESAGTFQHHPGHQGVRRKVVPRRVVSAQRQAQDPYAQGQYETDQAYQQAAPVYYENAPEAAYYGEHQAHASVGRGPAPHAAAGYPPAGLPPSSHANSVAPSPVYYLGAALSLAMVIGVGVWGYKIAMRDVNGIPVVQAMDGPHRTQPDNPGGRQAEHQGLAVNEVQANGEATAAADRLILAPPAIDLLENDQPVSQIVPAVARITAPAETPANSLNDNIQLAVASAVAQVNGADGQAAPVEGRIPATVPGVSVSKVPVLRPALDLSSYNRQPVQQAAAEAAVATRVAAASSVDVDPSTLTVGTNLVQLGAFDNADVARAEWDRLAATHSAFFEGKQRIVQGSSRGGREFYRLRATGFSSMSDARQFCSELISRSSVCIPVVVR